MLAFFAGTGLVASLRQVRAVGLGWSLVYAVILATLGVARFRHEPRLTYLALGIWALFILAPNLISKLHQRFFMQGKYFSAYLCSLFISGLHPFGDWRRQPRVIRALDLAARGKFEDAVQRLKEFRDSESQIGQTAIVHLFRLTGQWPELIEWHAKRFPEGADDQFLPLLLRARGEIGDVQGLVAMFHQYQEQIARMPAPTTRDFCRLTLFAFCGRRDLLENLLAGSLAILPDRIKRFWLATADMTAGQSEAARSQLETLRAQADPPLRLAIERRLTQALPVASPSDQFIQHLIFNASQEMAHHDAFTVTQTLFSRRALATWILIVANIAMFAAEIHYGGSEDETVLYRLGAVKPYQVKHGEAWRLFTALFLHFGWFHIAANLFALAMVGPFVEFALGFSLYLLAYLTSGVGSMLVVASTKTDMIVGASGAIMGLVGVTVALMLKGWLSAGIHVAKQRLFSMLLVIAVQTYFDYRIPEISMTAHLSGAAIGFFIGLLLPNRLKTA